MQQNKLRWTCDKQGCYLKECHFPIEKLSAKLSGRNSFMDIDGLTERYGYFLFFESQTDEEISIGKRIAFERFSKIPGCEVLLALTFIPVSTGNVYKYSTYTNGKWSRWQSGNITTLQTYVGEFEKRSLEACKKKPLG